VHDSVADAAAHVVHAGEKIRVRIALVQEQRLATLGRQFELAFEREQLRCARRQVTKIIQARFADRNDLGLV
jgi:hypothetical protein